MKITQALCTFFIYSTLEAFKRYSKRDKNSELTFFSFINPTGIIIMTFLPGVGFRSNQANFVHSLLKQKTSVYDKTR